MMIDVAPRPVTERVWQWDGTFDEGQQIQAHLNELGRASGVSATFTDHEDGTATVRSDTYSNSVSYPVEAHRWYVVQVDWRGLEPVPATEAEINALYYPRPEYPPVFDGVDPQPLPSTGPEGSDTGGGTDPVN